jgi:hypothetical protein
VKSVKINGKVMKVISSDEVVLMYAELPANAKIEITTAGGWPKEFSATEYPAFPVLLSEKETESQIISKLPESLKKPFEVLTEMKGQLASRQDADYEKAYIEEAIASFEDYCVRIAMDPGPGYYRTITPERKESIIKFYEQAALSMYNGYVKHIENIVVN